MSRVNWDKALATYLARPLSDGGTDSRAMTVVAQMDPTRTHVVIPLAQFLVVLRERS